MQEQERDIKRNSFIFYRSYFEAIEQLPIEHQLPIYKAIAEYALNNICSTLNGIENTVFTLVKPNLDTAIKNYVNGCKGGRPRKNKNPNETQTKPNHNPNKTQTKPYYDYNYNLDKDYKENISVFNTNTKEKKPSLKQVQEFCFDNQLKINPQEFFNYYEALGWKSGNTPIEDWKALAKSWELNKKPKANKQTFNEDMNNAARRLSTYEE